MLPSCLSMCRKEPFVSTELYQTEFHHVRTLKIMSEVYYKGLQKELQLDTRTLDKVMSVLRNRFTYGHAYMQY